MALPNDVALMLSSAGISTTLTGDALVTAIRSAIADRRGYLGELTVTEIGFRVELVSPHTMTFEGRTPELALAWVLIFLMRETG